MVMAPVIMMMVMACDYDDSDGTSDYDDGDGL